ncbi:MAG: AraC family transcriptional regulator [Bacteroidaceae bacterium]|nr:AraC family transcriptional regulator [Bacteroidaceae bacterium]
MNKRKRLSQSRADELYLSLLRYLMTDARYRTHESTQRQAAEALGVSVYTLSAAISQSLHTNYADLLNTLRLRDACTMLSDPACATLTAEYIGLSVGFASRQAFYLAFARKHHVTPKQYRQLHLPQD